MSILSTYSKLTYAGFEASPEILAAIEEIAGDDITDETSAAYRMWAEPTHEEQSNVIAIAWTFADADEESLIWGRKINRPR